MFSLILLLLINYVRTQQDICSCSCCIGQLCSPVFMGALPVQSCTTATCGTYCRASYLECRTESPNGQIVSQCYSVPSTISPLYNCQCDCCNNGATCTPVFVGLSTSYSCQPSSCSVSCSIQYPSQCISNQNGQTNGLCTGLITTTTIATTTTTISTVTLSTLTGSQLPNNCACMCCQSGPSCSPDIDVGTAVASQCSTSACTEACQNQYPPFCPSLAYLGQTNGTCRPQSSGNMCCRSIQVSLPLIIFLSIIVFSLFV